MRINRHNKAIPILQVNTTPGKKFYFKQIENIPHVDIVNNKQKTGAYHT